MFLRRSVAAATVMAGLALPGCGAQGHKAPAVAPLSQDATGGLLEGPAASIYRVPVPSVATLDARLSKAGTAAYKTPAGTTFDQVNRFYLALMPPGKPFNGLAWCDTTEAPNPGRTIQRSWRKKGTNDFLLVQVIDEGSTPPPQGAAVLIFDDKDDASGGCKP